LIQRYLGVSLEKDAKIDIVISSFCCIASSPPLGHYYSYIFTQIYHIPLPQLVQAVTQCINGSGEDASWTSSEMPSIMETFRVSQKRLSQPDGDAWQLLQFHGVIETEGFGNFDPREFFLGHFCLPTATDFPDGDILAAEGFHLRELFSELEAVSSGERLAIAKPMAFHFLWLECIRHAMGPRWESAVCSLYPSDVLLLNFQPAWQITPDTMEQRVNNFLAHVRCCLKVCRNFKISLEELNLSEPIQTWIEYLAESII
jgi:hypothetical protein